MTASKFQYLKTALFLLLTLTISGSSYGQYYERSAGVRLGDSYGLTFKRFFDERQAFEILLGGRNDGLHLTGIYQVNRPLNISKNETFFLYYGAGGHFGFEKYPTKRLLSFGQGSPDQFYFDNENYFSMGIDGLVGIEYRFLTAPITVGLDLKPYLTYLGFRYLRSDFWDSSLSVKYIF